MHTAYDKNISRFELQRQVKDLKADCPWLREVNSQSLQRAIGHLERAFTNFFEKRAGYPRYKKRSCRQRFHCPHCGERVLRDVNAALNIRALGILKITGVERTAEPVELPALAGAVKQEKFAGRSFG